MAQDDRPFDPKEIEVREGETVLMHMQRITNNLFLFLIDDGWMSQSYLGEEADVMNKNNPSAQPKASTKFMNQTNRQFFDEVLATATEVAGSLEEGRRIVMEWVGKKDDPEKSAVCCKFVVELYKQLRLKGYSIHDVRR